MIVMTTLKELEEEMDSHPYPSATMVFQGDPWRAERDAWQDVQAEILTRWKAQCLKDNGLEGHPKADAVMAMAWEHGHDGTIR